MTQRQIDAAHRRGSKTVYKHLAPVQYRMVKAIERQEQLQKDIAEIYRLGQVKYGENFRKDSRFQDDFEFIYELEGEIERLMGRMSRLEEKHGMDREEVMRFHRQMNQSYSAAMVGAVSF